MQIASRGDNLHEMSKLIVWKKKKKKKKKNKKTSSKCRPMNFYQEC